MEGRVIITSFSLDSKIAKIRSTPTLKPIQGISPPPKSDTKPSYLPPPAIEPTPNPP